MARGAWKRSPKALAARLERIKRTVPLEASGQVARAMSAIEKRLKERVHPAKVISRQDSPSGKRQQQSASKPYATSHATDRDGVTIRVTLGAFFTGARSKAAQAIFSSIGKKTLLTRKSLVVYLGNRGGKKKFRSDVKGRAGGRELRLSLTSHPRLKVWAQRADKGEQIQRHVVRLPKEALRRLIMVGTVKQSIPELLAAWHEGVRKGFL